MIIDVEAKIQLPRSSSIAEVCSLVGQLCAILYIITVCQLYWAVHIELVKKKVVFWVPVFLKKIRNSKNAIFLVFCRVLPCSMFSFVSAGYCGGLVYSNSRLHLLKSTAWSWKSNVSNGSLVKLRCCRGLTFGIARCRFGGMMLSSQPNVFLNHIAVPSHSPFCFVRPCCA